MTTIDEELQLIKRGRAMQPPPADPAGVDPVPGAFLNSFGEVDIAPDADAMAARPGDFAAQAAQAGPDAAVPPARDVDAELGLPAPEAGLASLPEDDAGFWEVAGASWQSETVKTDAWNYSERLRRDATSAIWDRLPAEAKQRIMDLKWDQANNWLRFEDLVVEEAAKIASSSPESAADFAGVPLTKEAFEAQIMGQRKAALAEAEGVLQTSDRWFAEFVGAGARAMTDETSLMLLPFGVSGSAWRTIAGEALLGAVGEAAILPREFEVAGELGLADPDPVERILLGAALGGGLSAGIIGVVKGISHLRARRAGVEAARLDGDDALDAEIAVEENDAAMRGDQTVAEVINASAATPGTLPAILADTGAATDGAFNEAAVLRTIIGVESGGRADAQAATSSARGLGQFISSTWMAMIQKHRPDLLQGRTPNQVLALRDDPQLNAQMTLQFMRDNRAALQSQGLPAGPGETYLAHFMGVGGASRALRAPLETPITSVMDAKAIAANRGIRHNNKSFDQFTVFDLRQWANAKMRRASAPGADADMPVYSGPTSRGYTGTGQISVGGETRIDVEYVVVDASTLTRASGEFQPRDRSRGASDAWIADTAARLDPAQLMPSPTADRGTPIIGPDNMIESGNGRYGAIVRAYERFPDRAAAYRGQIEASGFAIPEGVERPVLVARRTTDLTREQRIQLTVDAQDSGVALMSPTELAQVQARAMTPSVLAKFDPAASLDDAANAGFVRAVMDLLPRSARGAMIDAKKILNANGKKQLRDALFARAWNDPDVIEMFAEAEAGELRSLLDALETAAPNWAALKADIEAGLVRPEMDISGHVLDAMRLIANARKIAAQEQARRAGLPKGERGSFSIGDALTELLDEVDLLAGPVAPLTAALVRKFWTGGKATPAGQVATFLTRYADDARKVGQGGGLFGDAPGPRDVLQAIDGKAFADLPADLGPVRGFARPNSGAPEGELPAQALPDEGFEAGASSPEAQAVQAEIRAGLEAPDVAQSAPSAADVMKGFAAGQPPQTVALSSLARDQQDALADTLKKAQRYDSAEAVYAAAVPNHNELNQVAADVAAELGLDFKPAPVKDLARLVEKVTDKYRGNYRKIADVARTGVSAPTIEAADAFIAGLGRRFHLIDEGWAITPAGYFDRKVMVRFDDGQLGEIQVWPPGMLEAKSKADLTRFGYDATYVNAKGETKAFAGGHKLYAISRDAVASPEARAKAEADMRVLYAEVADQLDGSFAASLGIGAPKAASRAAASEAVISPARSSDATSTASARLGSDQASPVQSEAVPSSNMAATSDTSNRNSFMGDVLSDGDASNIGPLPGDVNRAEMARAGADFAEFDIDLPDGSTARVSDVLADLDDDAGFDAFLQACALSPIGGAA